MNWIDALKIVGPLVLATVPGAAPFVPLILKGIEVAEESKVPGAKKKETAKDIVGLAANVINTVTKIPAVDPHLAVNIADQSIDLVIKATNEFHNESNNVSEKH